MGSYRVEPYIRAAVALQDMGKDKARDTLSKLAKSREHDSQVIVLCRMLFTRKAKGEFHRPSLGAALFLGGTDYTDWPLEPIELVDGVPFLITRGYDVGGEAEPAEAYLKYCLRNCDWNSTRFKPKSAQEKQKALQKLLSSPKWKARLNDADKSFLSSQILPGDIDEVGTGSGRTDEAINLTDALSVRFFPMKVGYKWVYAFEDKEVNFEVLRNEKSRGTTVFVIRRTFENRQVEYKLAVEESGVYIHQEGTKVFSPPLRQFAFLPRTGDLWKWRGTVGGKRVTRRFEHLGVDKITVPAGTYQTLSIYEEEDNGDHATYWLAEGVGIVMLSGKSELFGGKRVVFEWKLKRFDKGKE